MSLACVRRLATVVLSTLLLLLLLGFFAKADNNAAVTIHSTEHLQLQRLRAFTKYVERVGTALDLLINGPVERPDDAEDAHCTLAELNDKDHLRQQQGDSKRILNIPDLPMNTGFNALSVLTQFMQYPHTALRAAVAAATEKAAAARTLAAVLTNSKLSSDEETLLAQVRTAAGHDDSFRDARLSSTATQDVMAGPSLSSVFSPPSAIHRVRAPFIKATQTTVMNSARRAPNLADTLSTPSRYISCENGYVALASNTAMLCATAGRSTIGDYPSIPAADRATCNIVPVDFNSLEQQCVCSIDAVLIQNTERSFTCITRPVDVQVLLDEAYLCHSAADVALGLPDTMEGEYCIKTTRNANLSVAMRWKYSYLSLDALRAAVNTSTNFVTPHDVPTNSAALQWVVMGATPPSGVIASGNGSLYAQGRYSQLTINKDLFTFLSPITAEMAEEAAATGVGAFHISNTSKLYEATAFQAVFCFAAPRKTKDHLVETPLSTPARMSVYFGNVNGTTTHTLHLDLSNVSDDFIEGNQMYVEAGVRGGSTAYTYRVARLHISFSDLAVPSDRTYHYKKQFNPLYILLIVAVGVVVVGTSLAVLWYHLIQQEEYDDSAVADAQFKKGFHGAPVS